MGLNEENLDDSVVAVKKREFRNIDIVKLGFLHEIANRLEQEQKG